MADGDEVIPRRWFPFTSGMKIACCDCGLVHVWEIKKKNGKFMLRCWRDNRSTAGTRRYNKFDKK